MRIATINGFLFHYELFGYIIHFCKENNHELTIYWHIGEDRGYLDLYKIVFPDFIFNIQPIDDYYYANFDNIFEPYDVIILATDNDESFHTMNPRINSKTICIEHYFETRRARLEHLVATRPFDIHHKKDWALPCYSILNLCDKPVVALDDLPEINIGIVGSTHTYYNTSIINRIKYKDHKIIIHAFARDITLEKFDVFGGIRPGVDLRIYKNLDTISLITAVNKCQFILTDHAYDKSYECQSMSGAIPLSFSLLIPLIISCQTNSYYHFKNVIIFDKYCYDDIELNNIDIGLLNEERDALFQHNFNTFNNHIKQIKTPDL